MASLSDQAQAYLKKASPRFRELYATFERAVRERFPDAEASFQFRMPGWRVRRRRRVDPASVVGTLDPNWVQIYLEERKFGTILHLWNPIDVNGFRKRKADLERVGFKLMADGIAFNRKSEYPMGLVAALLEDLKMSLEEDGARGAAKATTEPPVPAAGRGRETRDEALRRQLDEWAAEPPMGGGD